MKILGNGYVEISNAQTGEKKTVSPDELSGYSPFLAKQYGDYLAVKKANTPAGPGINPMTYLDQTDLPQTGGNMSQASGDSGFFNLDNTNNTATPTAGFQGSDPNLFANSNGVMLPGGVSVPSITSPTSMPVSKPMASSNPMQGLDLSGIELGNNGQLQFKKSKGGLGSGGMGGY